MRTRRGDRNLLVGEIAAGKNGNVAKRDVDKKTARRKHQGEGVRGNSRGKKKSRGSSNISGAE